MKPALMTSFAANVESASNVSAVKATTAKNAASVKTA